MIRGLVVLATAALVSAAFAQSDIDSVNKYAWSENAGWLNWQHNRPDAGDGVQIFDTYLAGFVWGENIGWINLGDGSPANGLTYGNLSGVDFGVNVQSSSDELYGLAWGENIGWLNFAGGALATPRNPARIDFASCRLRGYAWGENIGWINLDNSAHYVGLTGGACGGSCTGDINGDGVIDLIDLSTLLANYGTGTTPDDGDLDGDGDVDLIDLTTLLAVYGQTCG